MRVTGKKITFMITDIFLINAAVLIALALRFEGNAPIHYIEIYSYTFILLTFSKITLYYLLGLYTSLWRYASIDEMMKIFLAVCAGCVFDFSFGLYYDLLLPKSVYILAGILVFIFIGGSRISYRVLRRVRSLSHVRSESRVRVMVIGAGDAGAMVIREMIGHEHLSYEPVAVIDDSNQKQRSSICGVPVVGKRDSIIDMAEKYQINEIVIAMPSVSKETISEILHICKQTKCRLKTLPSMYETIDTQVSIKHMREIRIEDLLGREEVLLPTDQISSYLRDQVILVTGGGGSIGSELCRQIARFAPKKLLILDVYENGAYDLQQELLRIYGEKLDMEVIIASVRDKVHLRVIFRQYKPAIIFHAAAHKHVPLMESNAAEAVKNNVFGTLNTAQCAAEFHAKRFVLISTDKAVNPTNIMGASKRVAEMIIQSLDKQSNTEFVAVRFGNVLGSNGSVIPLFNKQIAQGGPITVTHPDVIRYFMTIPEAVRLVIQAGSMAEGGEIFILDMGKPVKIVDLARDLIRLFGYVPDVDIKIEYTGLRPGEKLFEELTLKEECIKNSACSQIFIGQPLKISYQEMLLFIKSLEACLYNPSDLRDCMANIVTTYNHGLDFSSKNKKDLIHNEHIKSSNYKM
jgi:FlaA1/EpsC-like NDP-sugar epimerase